MYRLTTPPLSNPDPLLQVEATQSTDTAMEYTFYKKNAKKHTEPLHRPRTGTTQPLPLTTHWNV